MSSLALVPVRAKATLSEAKTQPRKLPRKKPAAETASQILIRSVYAAISQATFGLSPAGTLRLYKVSSRKRSRTLPVLNPAES
jgi:hypothetical protein